MAHQSTSETNQITKPNNNSPRASSFEQPRCSFVLTLSPLLLLDGLSRKSASYDKLPEQPLKLSVLKLDGSSFDIEVAKNANIAELKLAVEAAFSHLPQKGQGKVSWPQVWGHFCLCHKEHKLVVDSEYIRDYGIKDGDQLRFIRHLSISYNLIKMRHKKRYIASKTKNMSDMEERNETKHANSNHPKLRHNVGVADQGCFVGQRGVRFSRSLGQLFSRCRIMAAAPQKPKPKPQRVSSSEGFKRSHAL